MHVFSPSSNPMNKVEPQAIFLKDYTPPDYLVDTVNLRFELDAARTRVESTLQLRRHGDHTRPLVLDGVELELESVWLDGVLLEPDRYRVDDESLRLDNVPAGFELKVRNWIRPEDNTSLEGLYKSANTFCTQCEAEGFRKITYYVDRPDVMARFTTTVVANGERYPTLLSNGNPVAAGKDGDRHWVTWEDPHPKPAYLFALVAGDLACLEDNFTTASGREVTLRIFAEHHNAERCGHAMQALHKAMRWDEQVYGLEYDLDIFMIVAVDDFNMGAMENKGLNVFNSKYVLANPQTATDDDYAAIESVIAHEYFHNWTGNRITLRDWFQLSLKEGLTVFRDQEFSADTFSRALSRIRDVRVLRSHQFPEDAGPMAHPVRPASYIEINNFYTVTVYNKGAEVIRMMHTLLGAKRFRQGMDLYFQRHDGAAVTTDDFVAAMEDASGVDLTRFRRWYSQAGTPRLQVTGHYNADERTYELDVAQSCATTPDGSDKLPFHIPLAVGLLGADGRSLALTLDAPQPPNTASAANNTVVLDITEPKQVFRFTGVAEAPVASLLRDFSAPVNVEMERASGELEFMCAHDPDPFNRWDAGQRVGLELILAGIDEHQAGREPNAKSAEAFCEAMRRTLTDPGLDAGLIGEALVLPAETYIAEQVDEVDVEAIHATREWLRGQLARQLKNDLKTVFFNSSSNAPYRFEPLAAGRRKLKNVCLAYLMELKEPEVHDECLAQFQHADNMTDMLAAFQILTSFDTDAREAVLEEFFDRYRDDTLVLDKWFATQATSRLPGTLHTVRKLMQHPAFSIKNPNKVRALVGAFCFGNPVRFHAADGTGYEFLAEQVSRLDPLNSQVAARLLGALARWRRFDEQRQALMRSALEQIIALPGVSRDTYEIATKTLAA